MLVFIDDPGDPGFNMEKGSSSFFIIALVVFNDELEAEKTAIAIKELKRELKFPDDVEFKFCKSRPQVRKKFLLSVCRYDFKVRYLVVDKKNIYSPELRGNKNSFYSFAIKTVLKYSKNIINAKIRIDGSGDRVFRKNFLGYLRKQLNNENKKVIKNCKLVNSKENVLIQLADMMAGSARRSYDEGRENKNEYLEIINASRKIENIWLFK